MRRWLLALCGILLLVVSGSGQGKAVKTPSGLRYIDHVAGKGQEARTGDKVRVHYTGWLYEKGARGGKFDSSKDRDKPFTFTLGAGNVIKGWDEGVKGMKVGESVS